MVQPLYNKAFKQKKYINPLVERVSPSHCLLVVFNSSIHCVITLISCIGVLVCYG
jgi:hypothetical protein